MGTLIVLVILVVVFGGVIALGRAQQRRSGLGRFDGGDAADDGGGVSGHHGHHGGSGGHHGGSSGHHGGGFSGGGGHHG